MSLFKKTDPLLYFPTEDQRNTECVNINAVTEMIDNEIKNYKPQKDQYRALVRLKLRLLEKWAKETKQ